MQDLWAVTSAGVLFLDKARRPDGWPIKLYSFATKQIMELATVQSDDRRDAHIGFSAPQDGRYLLWTRREGRRADIFAFDRWIRPDPVQK